MAEQRVSTAVGNQAETRQALKRRGLIAGAATLAAGLLAARTAQPVLAANLVLDTDQPSTANTNIHGPGALPPWSAHATINPVFSVNNTSTGDGLAAKAPHYAIYGETTSAIGVFGVATGINGVGVSGIGGGGSGVEGTATTGNGVNGTSDSNHGVYGSSSGGATIAGVYGRNDTGIGVSGFSAGGNGVVGTSTSGYGVLGYSTGGAASVQGISTNINIPAFAGGTSVTNGLAAHFTGTVYVDCTTEGGHFVVNPMAAKSGLLKHPDGSHRLMYTMEAPESWAEDFGKATLTNGVAHVTLDPEFAPLIEPDYHVFLTEYGGYSGLYVEAQTAAGFVVRADKAGASGGFSWRIVAKPKSDRAVERLAKFAVPHVKYPDPAQIVTTPAGALPPSPRKP